MGEEESIQHDRAYSPSSERETEVRQHESPKGDAAPSDPQIDQSAVRQAPGEGGPDDPGDVEAPADEVGNIAEVMQRGERALREGNTGSDER
ncbi:hypothetical protein ACO2Q7_04165 [Rathayibacter sp. KR2-224]|uniref:hypothetical protein n=1 Tax=Rathayibacter sp. KR2-224 TaxID=3400913 RepID=UPI003C075E88